MSAQPQPGSGQRHPDTLIVDQLTALLNRHPEPSGADAVALLCQLIAGSGRPLLAETWLIEVDSTEDRYGIAIATVTAGPYLIRVSQATDGTAELRVDIAVEDGDDHGLAITVNGRSVLDPVPHARSGTSTVPPDRQPSHRLTAVSHDLGGTFTDDH